jgi:hypothetical protein
VAVLPVAHTLVDLRIAVMVTHSGARPYYRLAGLGFNRVGFDTSFFLHFVFGLVQLYSPAVRSLAIVGGRYREFR